MDFSRGMDFISAALDFLLSIINGAGTDSPQEYQYETIMIKDGIVDKLQQFTAFENSQENNESLFTAKNSIKTFLRLLQLHQNVIFSLFEFDITKETECRVDMFNPFDSTSTFNFLTKCVNDESLIQSFILSSIDINNHTTESYFKHLNRINYFTRIGLRKGYSFDEAFSKAVRNDIELKSDLNVNFEPTLTVPQNITDLQMREDFQNLYTHIFCDFKFTGFWDLPDEPPEMKYTSSFEEQRENLLKAEQLKILNIEQEEKLKKQEIRQNFLEKKLKEILGDEEYSKLVDQADNQVIKENQEKPTTQEIKEKIEIKNDHKFNEIESPQKIEKEDKTENKIELIPPPPPPPPPPPGSAIKVQPLDPPYKMDHVINIEKVGPGRIKDTIWNEIVPNEFEVDFAPLEEYLKKDASQKPKKVIQKVKERIIDASFDKEICIPFKSFKDRCPKIDEVSIMNEIKEKINPEIEKDDQNKLNFLTKKEIMKKQIEYLEKSLLTVNEDGIMPESFCINLLNYIRPQKDEKMSKFDFLKEKIERIKNDQIKFKDQMIILSKELETESGMILDTFLKIPHLQERLEFIMLKYLYTQTIEEFIGPIENTKSAFSRIRNSEKFKHFLEMSLKIINMMSSTFDRKNNRSGMRGFKLGFISQFTATQERRKNLEAFWVASNNNSLVNGFMDDIELFEAAKSFEPNETFLQFQELLKQYKNISKKFNELKESQKNSNNNDDDVYLLSKWEDFDAQYGEKIVNMTIDFEKDCEKMYDVMVYFDQCGSVTKNKFGLFRANARDFINVMDEIYKAMINAKRRIKLHEEEAERKAKKLARIQVKTTTSANLKTEQLPSNT